MCEGTYRVPGLLSEDLRKLDHVRVVVELLREVDHAIGSVLLVTRTSGGQERAERVHRDGVALLATASGVTGGLPLLRRVRDRLGNTSLQGQG